MEFKGRTIVLRHLADKVVFWLEKFKQVGDIAVNVDPLHAGLPWACIRLLLQVIHNGGIILHAINSRTGSHGRKPANGDSSLGS